MICRMRGSSIDCARLLAVLAGALVACGGSSGPGETPPINPMTYGRFDVVTWEARTLPETLRVLAGNSTTPGGPSFRCPEVLMSGTLDVGQDGTLTRTEHLAYPCTGSQPTGMPDTLTQVETGTAYIVGDSVALTIGPTTAGVSSSSKEYGRLRNTDLVIGQVRTGINFGSVEQLANARVYRHE